MILDGVDGPQRVRGSMVISTGRKSMRICFLKPYRLLQIGPPGGLVISRLVGYRLDDARNSDKNAELRGQDTALLSYLS